MPFFGKAISRHGMSPDPTKVKVLMDMPPPKMKENYRHSWVSYTSSHKQLWRYANYSKADINQ